MTLNTHSRSKDWINILEYSFTNNVCCYNFICGEPENVDVILLGHSGSWNSSFVNIYAWIEVTVNICMLSFAMCVAVEDPGKISWRRHEPRHRSTTTRPTSDLRDAQSADVWHSGQFAGWVQETSAAWCHVLDASVPTLSWCCAASTARFTVFVLFDVSLSVSQSIYQSFSSINQPSSQPVISNTINEICVLVVLLYP